MLFADEESRFCEACELERLRELQVMRLEDERST